MRKLCLELSFVAIVLLVACGGEITTNVIQTTGMTVIAKGDKVPDCSVDIEGTMIYVADSSAAFFCTDGKWQPLKGENGENGPQGDSVGVLLNGNDGVEGKRFVTGWMVDPRDKQIYKTATIGQQIWMAENLNYAYTAPTKDNGLDSSSFCLNDDPANCTRYGRLYLWSAAMDSAGVIDGNTANGCGDGAKCSSSGIVRGVCPQGWHLPSEAEWEKLIVAVDGSITEYDMKNMAGIKFRSVSGWNDYDDKSGNGTDAYSFSALPAGYMMGNGKFSDVGNAMGFWSSVDYESGRAFIMYLHYGEDYASMYPHYKQYGFSVRCLKD